MAKISASQAAKLAGKSIPTITRAIKSSRLSADRTERGGYLIEVSELERVFPLKAPVSNDRVSTLDSETPNNTSALEVEVKMLREMLEKTETDRDEWKEQAKKITAMIEDHSINPPRFKWFWQRG